MRFLADPAARARVTSGRRGIEERAADITRIEKYLAGGPVVGVGSHAHQDAAAGHSSFGLGQLAGVDGL
jgi:hypothetical protein